MGECNEGPNHHEQLLQEWETGLTQAGHHVPNHACAAVALEKDYCKRDASDRVEKLNSALLGDSRFICKN